MTKSDFVNYGIVCFSASEIIATGAQLKDVQARLIQHLDRLRRLLGTPIYLVKNGLTTGSHTSELHADGLAVDCTMGCIEPNAILKTALEADFRGIGFYWNKKWTSVHLDLRPAHAFWIGVKKGSKWSYRALIQNPA